MTPSQRGLDLAEGEDVLVSIFWRLSVTSPCVAVGSIDYGCLRTRPKVWCVRPTMVECMDVDGVGCSVFLYGVSRRGPMSGTFHIVVANTNEQQLKERGACFSAQFEDTVHHGRKCLQHKALVVWHPQSGGRERCTLWWSAGFLLIWSRSPAHRILLPTFIISIKPTQKPPDSHAQRVRLPVTKPRKLSSVPERIGVKCFYNDQGVVFQVI